MAVITFANAEEVQRLGFAKDLPIRRLAAHRRIVGGYVATQIKDITAVDYKGFVWNLEVDGDHLLCVEGIVSHNCFNGLYRVNQKGEFNVPFGRYKNPKVCDAENLQACNEILKDRLRVNITCMDYEAATEKAKKGDLIFFDPPYIPTSKTSNFTSYIPGGWDLSEHIRLSKVFGRLAKRGVSVMLSNSDTPLARKLYRGFRIIRTQVRRSINSDAGKRGHVGEILVLANC